jgi:hypothetical protein
MLVLAALLAACSERSPPVSVPAPGPEWKLRTPVVFVEDDYRTPRAAPPPDRFRLSFQYVGGGLFGGYTATGPQGIRAGPDGTFVLDLTGSGAAVAAAARVVAGGPGARRGRNPPLPALDVTPASLRMTRVAVFTYNASGTSRIGYTAWTDTTDGAHYILAWFDRPGLITGVLDEPGGRIEYHIRVDTPGYQWLRWTEREGGAPLVESSAGPARRVLHVAPLRD